MRFLAFLTRNILAGTLSGIFTFALARVVVSAAGFDPLGGWWLAFWMLLWWLLARIFWMQERERRL